MDSGFWTYVPKWPRRLLKVDRYNKRPIGTVPRSSDGWSLGTAMLGCVQHHRIQTLCKWGVRNAHSWRLEDYRVERFSGRDGHKAGILKELGAEGWKGEEACTLAIKISLCSLVIYT